MYKPLGKSILILSFIFLTSTILGQVKTTIKGNIKGLKDTTVYLANYYGNKLYYNDTTRVDSKGNYSFKGKPFNESGKYALVMPGPKYYDFLVADEDIVIDADTSNKIEKIVVKKSENNRIFFEYINYINSKRAEREPIDKVLSDTTKSEADKAPELNKLKKLNDEVIAYQKNLISKNSQMLVAKIIKMSMDVEVPAPPMDIKEEDKKLWSYYYYRSHYWDNTDLKDPRLVRDQSFHKLIDKYITQTLPQIPDTMTMEAKRLIEQTAGNEDAFKYIVHQFTYNFETSKIMCMDEGFVYMVDNYYSKGLCSWMKEDKLKEMKKSADEKRNCLCGEVGLNIILPDTSDIWQNMYELNSKYTLLVIYESTCGHCKKEVPKINDLYKKWKGKGLEVFAVHNNLEVDKWKAFVKENNLEFTNVCRTSGIMNQDSATKLIYSGVTTLQSLNFHQYWDVTSTPKVYLMDKDHKVIAKSLSAEQFDELLHKLEAGGKLDEPLRSHEYEDEDEPKANKKNQPKQPSPKQNNTPKK